MIKKLKISVGHKRNTIRENSASRGIYLKFQQYFTQNSTFSFIHLLAPSVVLHTNFHTFTKTFTKTFTLSQKFLTLTKSFTAVRTLIRGF